MSAFNQIERTPHNANTYRRTVSTTHAVTENYITPIAILGFFGFVILVATGVIPWS